MKNLGVIASFLLILVATTVAGPKPAKALHGVGTGPFDISVCVSSSGIGLIATCFRVLSFGYTLEGNTQLGTNRDGSISLASRGGSIGNVTITKAFDTEFSPWLIMSAISGQAWNQVLIVVWDTTIAPGDCDTADPHLCTVFAVDMRNVFVASSDTSGTPVYNAIYEVTTFVADSAEVTFP